MIRPSRVHSIKLRDRRTSACGLWWWYQGGEPASSIELVTCQQCQRSRGQAFDGKVDRRRPILVTWFLGHAPARSV